MHFHIVANTHRPDAVEAAMETATWLKSKGSTVGTDSESARRVSLPIVATADFGAADAVIAFGGDGTLIRAAHLVEERGTPILGVYYGRFGFVTQCRGDEVQSCLEAFFAGECQMETRMMLRADLLRHGQPVMPIHSLNEVILQRAVTDRMMTFHVSVDSTIVARYPADGVIICTPTGSTAYNLSAGGPLLDPQAEALAITPLAPHTLAARSLVLRPTSEIHLRMESVGDAVLSCDGQTRLHILSGDEVRITRSNRTTRLIVVDPQDFLTKLGQRLFFSQSMYGDAQ